MGLDADLGVEIEAVEAGFASGGELQRAVALGDVVRGVGLGVLTRRGEGVGERELVLVVYDIWVGSYRAGENIRTTLNITELRSNHP